MITEMKRDPSLDALLDLDGQVLVVDPETRHWVRFVVQRVPVSEAKPHGLDYSLTLHGPHGERWAGSTMPIRSKAVAGLPERRKQPSTINTGLKRCGPMIIRTRLLC